MRVEKKVTDGVRIVNAGGELVLTDRELDLSIELPKAGAKLNEEQIMAIQESVEDHGDFFPPITSVERVDGLFARLDLGGYWSGWVVGTDIEDVMEQLDDLHGVYNDYL